MLLKAATSLAAPRTNIVKSDGVFEQDAGKPRM